jgi:hypothetical protein
MKLEFSREIFEKCSNIKFHENSSIESRVVPCGWTDGQTDMTKLVVAFRNIANGREAIKGNNESQNGDNHVKKGTENSRNVMCTMCTTYI